MEEFQIENIDPNQYTFQDYSDKDLNLLEPILLNKSFGFPEDVIEFHLLDSDGEIIESDYNYRNYQNRNTIENSSLFDLIELDPEKDLLRLGYSDGQFNIVYNFYRNLFGSSYNNNFFIKEISTDRTEIKIINPNIDYLNLQSLYINYIANRNQNAFYSDFFINLGNNKTLIGVNVLLDNVNTNEPGLYIKLYEPLPGEIELKTKLWVNESISDSYSYKLNKEFIFESTSDFNLLKGPNFDIEVNKQISTNTPYLNISNILDTNISSSYNRLQNILKDGIQINIDYNNFENFIHFSSIKERLDNFYYKIIQIQTLENDLNILTNLSSSAEPGSINNSIIGIQNKINNIVQNFDGYENFLYNESGSNSYPKQNSTKPFINLPYNSTEVLTWLGSDDEQNGYYGGKLLEAFNYDNQNRDYLWNNLPEYIKFDTQNEQLKIFVSMLGQHFDYIWTYIKDITNKNIADNRIDFGISKDLVAETLKSFGIKLYTNSRNKQDIFLSLFGMDAYGSFLPSTGSYNINTYITSSNYTIPDNDIQKEVYKRIYHNLPYLLKTKGTKRGLRALINCFGIPDTILSIKEYGGVIKELDYIENTINKFNYSLNNNIFNILKIPFYPSNQQYINTGFDDIYPDTIEFRFKNYSNPISNFTQSLIEFEQMNFINVTTAYISESLGEIKLSIKDYDNELVSSSVSLTLPIYDGGWWNVNLTRETGSIRTDQTGSNQTYTITIGNKNQYGIQYLESASIFIDGSVSSSYNKSWNSFNKILLGGGTVNNVFSGSLQEFRYWIGSIPIEDFKDHILNPKSISYLNETSSYNNLIFRLPLGSELDTLKQNINSSSYHPSQILSFISGGISSSITENTSPNFIIYEPNYEEYKLNSPVLFESNEKIKIIESDILPDNTLSPNISIEKPLEFEQTEINTNLEVAFSPQDSINYNIIEQLGNFNLDEYIGDPRDKQKTKYPDLNKLKSFYYQKFLRKQNIFDLIKLLSYFDNSLFKMIKDFIPAKSDIATGFVVKSPILERNKALIFEPVLNTSYFEGELNTAFISGTNPVSTNLLTSNTKEYSYVSGAFIVNNNDNKEWFTGDLKGNNITIHKQSDKNIVYENNTIDPANLGINSNYSQIPINPILNNVEKYKKNTKYLNVDYSNNINLAINNDLITASLLDGIEDPLIFADIQESNYSLSRHIIPRYLGSKTISKTYNKWNEGDKSYGKTAAIDKKSTRFAYFQEITSQSLTLPGRTNAYIKYLIDKDSNITELTRQNKSLFDVQSIFNIEKVDIILDDNLSPSKQQQLDGLKNIYIGGFRYEPVLQNIVGSHKFLEYTYETDITVPNISGSGSTFQYLGSSSLIIGNPVLGNGITYTQGYNNISITASLDSEIYFPVQRNTGYDGEIIQRISGSFEFISYVSPPTDKKIQFYSGKDYTGIVKEFNAPLYYDSYNMGPVPDPITGELIHVNRDVVSLKVPEGVNLILYNAVIDGGVLFTPGDYPNSSYAGGGCFAFGNSGLMPLCSGTGGATGFDARILNSLITLEVDNQWNPFSPVIGGIDNDVLFLDDIIGQQSYSSSSFGNSITTPITLEKINEVGVKITFNIDGYIILPANQNSGNIPLRVIPNLLSNPDRIKSKITFINQTTSNKIQFYSNPTFVSKLNRLNTPFLFGSPPSILYISGVLDNGFFSGSETNWYFKRGIYEGGNLFNLVTASYDLSNIVYNKIQTGNNFIQSFPPFSYLGYEDVESFFDIKVGDLIRFYNHDKNEFPIPFEREIIKIIYPSNPPHPTLIDKTNRLFILVNDNIPDQSCVDNYNEIKTDIQNFIILSKISDETNVILNTSKKEGETSPGILIPENLDPKFKGEAGNIIKQLKNQNLI